MKRCILACLAIALAAPVPSAADHDPQHDTRHNPNCAFDARRSSDANGDGEPDHMTTGVSHDTSFPRQVVVLVWKPITGEDELPPFFGGHDGPDQVTFFMQGDHRMLGANPAHQGSGEPEQLHNGAIYANVDYDDVEHGRAPKATAGAGIYEADHLVMACWSTDRAPEEYEAAACLAGNEIYRHTDEVCPTE